jgi:hypothetical protein
VRAAHPTIELYQEWADVLTSTNLLFFKSASLIQTAFHGHHVRDGNYDDSLDADADFDKSLDGNFDNRRPAG